MSSSKDIQDWNRITNCHARFAGANIFINQQFASVLWDSLGNVRGLDILDLGCGTGWLSQLLSEAGAKVIGVNGSIEHLNLRELLTLTLTLLNMI